MQPNSGEEEHKIQDFVERERERKIKRQRDRDRETDRQTNRERENSNSKTLFYKDCSLGSVKNLTNN